MNDINTLSSKKQENLARPRKISHKRKDVHILIRLFFLASSFFVLCLITFYIYTTQFSSKDTSSQILKDLSHLVVLPAEEPSLFRVGDTKELSKANSFFKDAKEEDILLIFTGSKKIILYRPGEKKIVTMGPLKEDALPVTSREVYSTPLGTASTSSTQTLPETQN